MPNARGEGQREHDRKRRSRKGNERQGCTHSWRSKGKAWLLAQGSDVKVQLCECTECGLLKHQRVSDIIEREGVDA